MLWIGLGVSRAVVAISRAKEQEKVRKVHAIGALRKTDRDRNYWMQAVGD